MFQVLASPLKRHMLYIALEQEKAENKRFTEMFKAVMYGANVGAHTATVVHNVFSKGAVEPVGNIYLPEDWKSLDDEPEIDPVEFGKARAEGFWEDWQRGRG